jgi:hypothetical protein
VTKPLAIDLFCGLGGWTDGLLAEGYDVIGYDIEEHAYGDMRYPAKLVLQDVLTLHGSRFKDAALIVASPPCQEYSYMAMPWKLAKAKAAAIRADTTGAELERLNRLFNACFRIQAEASLAAGRHIPMVVENVRGAQPWVGRARWNFGSFYLWGDVPALMPAVAARKNDGGSWFNVGSPGQKVLGKNPVHELAGQKMPSGAGRRTDPGKGARFTSRDCGIERRDGVKFSQTGDAWFDGKPRDKMLGHLGPAAYGSKSPQRKMASAMIAKIPLPLSRHIAASFKPDRAVAA